MINNGVFISKCCKCLVNRKKNHKIGELFQNEGPPDKEIWDYIPVNIDRIFIMLQLGRSR